MAVLGDLSRINTNVGALQALTSLNKINSDLSIRQLRLATGKRINSAQDDPAGFVISKTMEGRSRGLSVALANVGDARNVLTIAEGGLNNILDTLMTMRERVTQAANDTLGSSERNAIENQLDDLATQINDIVTQTSFNGNALIDGTYTSKTFQIGSGTGDTMSFGITQDHDAASLSVADSDLTVDSAANASTALSSVNAAINTVTSSIRSLGSTQSRLGVQESQLSTLITNTEAARSRIFDADLAREQLQSVKLQILQRTATTSLAQANTAPQAVLALFR